MRFIEAQNLCKTFKKSSSLFTKPIIHTALDNVNFTINHGSCCAILGPNGSGKTTLLKILANLILPDSGTAFFHLNPDHDAHHLPPSAGILLNENRSFYWRLSARKNLEFFASLYGMSPKQTKKSLTNLFEFFNINFQNQRFDSYSAGMMRKCALIRAIMHNPSCIFFDEPFKSLDTDAVLLVKQLIQQKNKEGKTILLVTHNLDIANDVCDSVAIMNHGKLLLHEKIADLKQQHPNKSLQNIYHEHITE